MSYNYEDYVPNQGIVCPICQQACSSLQVLNVHIDTVHSEEDTKGALLSWFKQAQKKVQTTLIKQPSASTSSPISSFKSFTALDQSTTFLSQIQQLTQTELPDYFVCETERYLDNVTRDHWQHESNHDTCYIKGCGKVLNKGNNGKQHCRKCGHLFCDFHTKYEIKLNHQAQHDPENGVWAKVCGNCFMEREDYINHQGGAIRDKTSIFLQRRTKIIDKVYLETNRLEKRLEKLARLHYNIDSGKGYAEKILNHSSSSSFINIEKSDSASSSGLSVSSGTMSPKSSYMSSTSNSNSILSMKLKYRDGEQSVTKWQDDKGIKKCPLCLTTFTLTNRKHHCRLCGRVVCGAKHCSNNINEEPVGDTRACQDCKRVAFRRKIQNEESNLKQPIFKLYHQLTVTRHYIEKLLPKFHSMILILEQEKIVQQDHDTFKKAALVRKSVLDNFALYDTLVKSIKSLPTQTSSMKRLQSNICIAANLYLQQNMLPLQMLPRILNTTASSPSSKKNKKIASNGQQQQQQDQLLSQLQIYEEQFILVQGYISDAKKHRKYDEVKTLTISLNELQTEIDRLKQTISK